MILLSNIKEQARRTLDAALLINPDLAAEAKTILAEAKALLRKTSILKRRDQTRRTLDEIDRSFGTSKVFWSRWTARTRRFRESSTPKAVLNPEGEVITDPVAALQTWKEYVIKLGNKDSLPQSDHKVSQKSKYDDDFGRKVLNILGTTLSSDGTLIELTNPFTWEEIHVVVCQLDPSSAPGPDKISNEILRLAGLGFEMALTQLCNEIWTTLTWPTAWRVANLIPIYKRAGNKLDPSNHRMIALSNSLPKVFEKLLNKRMCEWADRVGALSDLC